VQLHLRSNSVLIIDLTEVVLSVLLNKFRFSPSGKEIGWTMNGIAGPYVKGADRTRPQLPIIMSLLDNGVQTDKDGIQE